MKITKLHYNWYYSSEGEDYEVAEVGKNRVVEIRAILPKCDGDKLAYSIIYDNGNVETIFNPNKVFLVIRLM